ncbi:MAG: nucleotidyltransferase family protein [Verrucomicrobiae bacterium]|nr:nucleotidyltransferase family protein [Verrucomicrobiae bacterium]
MIFTAIILAAGLSSRMGREKAALPWVGGTTLLEWTVALLVQTGWNPVVVLGSHNYPLWLPRLPQRQLVHNARSQSGKITSLAAGVREVPEEEGFFLVTSVDQPRPGEVYELLRQVCLQGNDPILVPDRAGRRGHPVVFHNRFRADLMHLSEATLGMRGFLDGQAGVIRRVPCDPRWLSWDCNTPDTYREALDWFTEQRAASPVSESQKSIDQP